jgi:hypothetical protein
MYFTPQIMLLERPIVRRFIPVVLLNMKCTSRTNRALFTNLSYNQQHFSGSAAIIRMFKKMKQKHPQHSRIDILKRHIRVVT